MSRARGRSLVLGALVLGGVASVLAQGCADTTSNGISADGGGRDASAEGGGGGDSGIPPIPDGGRDGQDSGVDPSTACDRCLAPKCANQWSKCQRNADCLRIYYCALNCSSTGPRTCVDHCFQSYPAGNADYFALASCNAYYGCNGRACAAACRTQLACVPNFDAGSGPLTCPQCADRKCATEQGRCGSGSECEQYSLCTATCDDPDIDKALKCVDDCGAAHPTGKANSDALAACVRNNCANECQ